MTAATTQQICVAAFHSYCRPTTQPITNQQYQIDAVRNEHEQSLIVPPVSKALVTTAFDALWKDAVPLATTVFIELDESLDLTESWTTFKEAFISTSESLDLTDSWVAAKIKLIAWAESLDLTDSFTTFKEAIISLAETLDLSDSTTANKEAFISLSESLDLADSTTTFKRAVIALAETLDLTDVTSSFKTAFRSLAESLDLLDETEELKIPGGPTTKFVTIDETLDLSDSWSVSKPSEIYRGGGRFQSIYRPIKDAFKIKRANFIYKFNLSETLSLIDSWSILPIIRNKGVQSPIPESMDLVDKWEVKVIRAGRNRILKQINNAFELLDFLDEFDTTGLAEDVKRINLNLTKTNRLTREVEDELKSILEKKINKVLADYKKAGGFVSSDTLKNKYKQEVEDEIRSAVQQSYLLATSYVGKVFKNQKVFLTQQDLQNIRVETTKISDSFWRQTNDMVRAYQLEQDAKLNPIPILAPKEPLKQASTIASIIGGLSAFGVLAKATLAKLQQLPRDDPTERRIIVYRTEGDEDVCPICDQYDNVEYYENNPFIIKPIDDTHPNCRCRLMIKGTGEFVTG